MHRWTNLRDKKLVQAVKGSQVYIMDLRFWVRELVEQCKVCQQVNVYVAKSKQGKRTRKPGKYGYKYLLVFVDNFSECVEAFSTKQDIVTVVAKKVLEEISPRFRVSKVTGSDKGPDFVSEVSQGLEEILGNNWKLHFVYHSWRSGQVEKKNRTLKETLMKLSLETGSVWVVILPLALF
jgi:transposase InsO family protein